MKRSRIDATGHLPGVACHTIRLGSLFIALVPLQRNFFPYSLFLRNTQRFRCIHIQKANDGLPFVNYRTGYPSRKSSYAHRRS